MEVSPTLPKLYYKIPKLKKFLLTFQSFDFNQKFSDKTRYSTNGEKPE